MILGKRKERRRGIVNLQPESKIMNLKLDRKPRDSTKSLRISMLKQTISI